MGRETACPGLRLKGGVYWVDIDGKRYGRIYESTGCSKTERQLAEAYYRKRLNRALEEKILGLRPRRTFRDAATEHLKEVTGKLKSIDIDIWAIEKWADPHIGVLELDKVHDGTLKPLVTSMGMKGLKNQSINLVLQTVRKILNKAARRWRDENGLTWLETAPLISMLPLTDKRPAYPLSWDEERKLLLPELPAHLERMALFTLNVGARDEEVSGLRWAWERRIPELDTADFKVSVFLLPDSKNGKPRLLVLNKAAKSIVDLCRSQHDEFVFTYKGHNRKEPGPVTTMNNTGWQKARARAAKRYKEELGMDAPQGFRTLHVHDLRHTFGRRLRALGVPNETRADLLGHSNGNITTDYSSAEIGELLAAARKLEVSQASTPTLTVLRVQAA